MGRLHYGSDLAYEFEDRVLAHLRVVITAKLLRQESFVFTWNEGPVQRTIWLQPATDLVFEFDDQAVEPVNRTWVELLTDLANSPSGLRLVEEPETGG